MNAPLRQSCAGDWEGLNSLAYRERKKIERQLGKLKEFRRLGRVQR
jgi:hypothetical protein